MLFLNRRGYSSFLMCTKCGYVRQVRRLRRQPYRSPRGQYAQMSLLRKAVLYADGMSQLSRAKLPSGQNRYAADSAAAGKAFPDVKVLRMDGRHHADKGKPRQILEAFAAQQAQILVGTQMIAKGHDFPKVTLVGILDGDQSLHHDDYMACERTFQLITQVAGRSGRSQDAGRVVLQTYTPQSLLSFLCRKAGLRGVLPPRNKRPGNGRVSSLYGDSAHFVSGRGGKGVHRRAYGAVRPTGQPARTACRRIFVFGQNALSPKNAPSANSVFRY